MGNRVGITYGGQRSCGSGVVVREKEVRQKSRRCAFVYAIQKDEGFNGESALIRGLDRSD